MPDFKIYKDESKTKYINRLMNDPNFSQAFKTKVAGKDYATKMYKIKQLEIKSRLIKKGIDILEEKERQDLINEKREGTKAKGLLEALNEKMQEFIKLKRESYK